MTTRPWIFFISLCLASILAAAAPAQDVDEAVLERARALLVDRAREQPPRPRTMDVSHYDLSVTPDMVNRRIRGSVRIDFKTWGVPRQHVELDADGLSIAEITDAEGTALEFRHEGSSLHVDLGRLVSPQQPCSMTIRYDGAPRRGLVWVASDPARPEVLDQLWSQGQSEMTRAWFPCRDYPDERASLTLHVTVAEHLRTISNGTRTDSVSSEDDELRTDHWQLDAEIPVYLTNLVVGEFETVDLGTAAGVPLEALAPAGHEAETAAALAHTGDMLSFLEDLTGAPYPYPVYRQVLVSEYPYGGMENASCTTLALRRLPAEAELGDQRLALDALLVHELAHQWWGDSITCGTWSDLWLNEGFVSYVEVLYLEHRHGRDAALSALLEMQAAAVETMLDSGRPVVCTHFATPDELYDSHVYEAGAVFLHLLRSVVGDEAFFAGLKQWTNERTNQCVRTADLLACFQEQTERDLDPLFQQWLHSPGRPVLRCSWRWDEEAKAVAVTVEQAQEGDLVPAAYQLPLDVVIGSNNERRYARIELTDRRQRVLVDAPDEPEYVQFNPGAAVPGRFEIEQRVDQWRAQLAQGTPLARRQAIDALGEWLEVHAEDSSDADRDSALSAVVKGMLHDESVMVRRAGAQAITRSGRPVAVTALGSALHDEDPRVRAAAVEGLSESPGNAKALDAILKAYALEESIAVKTAIATTLSELEFPELADLLEQLFGTARFAAPIRGAALQGLARLAPAKALPLALSQAEAGGDRRLRVDAIAALGILAADSLPAARALVELLGDAAPPVRFAAAAAAEEIRQRELLPALLDAHDAAPFDDLRAEIAALVGGLLGHESEDG